MRSSGWRGVAGAIIRRCLSCGHIGCCDDSKNKHATKHFHKAKHPVIQSFEPHESWRFCYLDEMTVDQ